MSKAVIVGASAGVGRALAERLAAEGWSLVLTAREREDLDAVACDLRLRYGGAIRVVAADIADAGFDPDGYLQACLEDGASDALLLLAGASDPADDAEAPDEAIVRLTRANYTGPLRVLGAFARAFAKNGRGTIVGFTSIAAHAPRRKNPIYASAKAGLESYLISLRHRFADTPIIVQAVALGYADTAMTFGKPLFFPAIAPEDAARNVIEGLGRDRGLVFLPCWWRWATLALKMLPWPLYKQLDF